MEKFLDYIKGPIDQNLCMIIWMEKHEEVPLSYHLHTSAQARAARI